MRMHAKTVPTSNGMILNPPFATSSAVREDAMQSWVWIAAARGWLPLVAAS